MGEISEPAVVGAIIQLGNCFDLLDTRYKEALQWMWPLFVEARVANGFDNADGLAVCEEHVVRWTRGCGELAHCDA